LHTCSEICKETLQYTLIFFKKIQETGVARFPLRWGVTTGQNFANRNRYETKRNHFEENQSSNESDGHLR
jgi:hypothetical protein